MDCMFKKLKNLQNETKIIKLYLNNIFYTNLSSPRKIVAYIKRIKFFAIINTRDNIF